MGLKKGTKPCRLDGDSEGDGLSPETTVTLGSGAAPGLIRIPEDCESGAENKVRSHFLGRLYKTITHRAPVHRGLP